MDLVECRHREDKKFGSLTKNTKLPKYRADNAYMHGILRNGRWYIIDIYLKIVIKTWIIVAHLKSICDA